MVRRQPAVVKVKNLGKSALTRFKGTANVDRSQVYGGTFKKQSGAKGGS